MYAAQSVQLRFSRHSNNAEALIVVAAWWVQSPTGTDEAILTHAGQPIHQTIPGAGC